jgi:hypothetical protein
MQFEYMVLMAAITGRTLVLPAPSPWYLINWGPIKREGDFGGVSQHGEFFDLDALKQYINVTTTDEFIRQEANRLNIPPELQGFGATNLDNERADDHKQSRELWKNWLTGNTHLVPWNPLNNLVYYPDIASVMASTNRPDERFIDSRTPVWFDSGMDDFPVLYFPSVPSQGYRQLGQVSRLVAFADEQSARYARWLLKHAIRYIPEIFGPAQTIIDKLGMFEYSSLHLRRNDIQFKVSRADPATTAANVSRLLKPGETLYLATDETDESFFADLKQQRKVIRFADLATVPGINKDLLQSIPPKLIGCVEQLVCAGGRIFAGTPFSSFSTNIMRLRGYINAPDLAEYSHTQLAGIEPRELGFIERSIRGTYYLHEDPVLWEDADLEEPIYSVSCTDTSDYIHWQCELLEYSWKQVGQTGELIRLVSREETDPLPDHKYTKVVSTKYTNIHPETGDRYAPYNRLFSFQEWLDTGEQHGTVLILDPDCVFRYRVTTRVKPGAPVAQRWRGFGVGPNMRRALPGITDIDFQQLQAITWPALVHTDDMRRLMPRWIELTSYIRQHVGAWESDMMAFVVAAAEMGLVFTDQHLVAVLNFPEDEGDEAPLIHYCQAVEAKDGSRLWYKQGYEAWQETGANPSLAKLPYCGDLIAILNEFVDSKQVDRTLTGNEAPRLDNDDSGSNDRKSSVPAAEVLVRAHLLHDCTLEFRCRRGDEAMQVLFNALNENSMREVPADRLIAVPCGDRAGDMSYFVRSSLLGLETVPL